MDTSSVRVICAVLAILFLGVIVLRRKKARKAIGYVPDRARE